MSAFFSVPPRRILLVCTQRIGDVLLMTPLLRSLRRAWPAARLEVLVLPGTEGVLAGNPDVDELLVLPQRVGWRDKLVQLRRLWQRYDLALSPLPTDRARLYCRIAGRRRIGLLQASGERSKRWLLDRWRPFDDLGTHTVSMGLRLTELLDIAACPEVVPPAAAWPPLRTGWVPLPADRPYAVLHPYPKFRYKMWTSAGWVALAQNLCARGWTVVLTGGPEAAECEYAAAIARAAGTGVLSLAGQLSLGETAELIRRAVVYVGPDTAVTHIAAATGTPTVALFGPSNPLKWGPWPAHWRVPDSPWAFQGSRRQGNVFLLQGEDARGCVPCRQEGCQRRIDSAADCLGNITLARVLAAVAAVLLPEGTGC